MIDDEKLNGHSYGLWSNEQAGNIKGDHFEVIKTCCILSNTRRLSRCNINLTLQAYQAVEYPSETVNKEALYTFKSGYLAQRSFSIKQMIVRFITT